VILATACGGYTAQRNRFEQIAELNIWRVLLCGTLRLSRSGVSSVFRPGERVRIVAVKDMGSERLLDGLTGEIICQHAFVSSWYKIWLDPNEVTAHSEWSVPADRLVACDEQLARAARASLT
jgi:hypothetical protein